MEDAYLTNTTFKDLILKYLIEEIIKEENLKENETLNFINNAFRDGEIRTAGVDFDKLLPPISRFNKGNNRQEKKIKIAEKLTAFFEKFFNIS